VVDSPLKSVKKIKKVIDRLKKICYNKDVNKKESIKKEREVIKNGEEDELQGST
jgi:hypothetical protein